MCYALIDKQILAQKLRIPKKQFTDLMKLKKKKGQNVDVSVLLRRENKALTGGNTGIKRGAGFEEKIIQRLPHLESTTNTATKHKHCC